MNASTQRDLAASAPPFAPAATPAERTPPLPGEQAELPPEFDSVEWEETRDEQGQGGADGRAVLGAALIILAVLWVGFAAWSAGRTVGAQPVSAPAVAQWLAIAAGPLAVLGLLWIMFGRTRRREAEKFTQSVISMRMEVRWLEELLGTVSQRIHDNQQALQQLSGEMVRLGEQTTERLAGITGELDTSTKLLQRHGDALDRAAESARNDIAVLLGDLPRAEQSARVISSTLQEAGRNALNQSEELGGRVDELIARTHEADSTLTEAARRVTDRLAEINQAGDSATRSLEDVLATASGDIEALLERSAQALEQIRTGIDSQSQAIVALVEQSAVGIGRAGIDSAEALAARVSQSRQEIDGLTAKLAEQDRASQRLFAGLESAIAGMDGRLAALSSDGETRTAALTGSFGRLRAELDGLLSRAGSSDSAIAMLTDRAMELRGTVDEIAVELRERLATGLGEAENGANRLLDAVESARPELEWMREAAGDAVTRIREADSGLGDQQERLAALLSNLDQGVTDTKDRLQELSRAINAAQADAGKLYAEAGPALVAALVQVREAAGQAAARARDAIAKVVPEAAAQLSQQTREALEGAIRSGVTDQLAAVDQVAAQAVATARQATDRLARQLLSIGQTATALEAHIEQTREDQRQADSEAFGRRVASLIDSLHSASIDVGKVLADEIDERSWQSYLKGDRAVFTRRAVRLIGNHEARSIQAQYDSDREFQQSVNRFVHDFEAMLRRVLAERDGGTLAVTLLSSDVGKLYAALGQAVDRRR